MHSLRFITGAIACVCALSPATGNAQTTTRVSVASDGTQGNGKSRYPAISADGRYVAFVSDATRLAPGDFNGYADVFVRDTTLLTTARDSVASDGTEANEQSFFVSISADGRYVAYDSTASNLVAGDENYERDVFLRDRATGTAKLVSVTSDGVQGTDFSHMPSISADGRYVAFSSEAANFAAGTRFNNAIVRDIEAATTSLVSVSSDGMPGDDDSFVVSINADGRYVVFVSDASNLVANDTNGLRDVFLRDRLQHTTVRISVSSDGTQANGASGFASVSADGRYVAFECNASNLVQDDTNGTWDVFLRDTLLGTTKRISIATGGTEGNAGSGNYGGVSISADGRYVAFTSSASNLVSDDTNGANDVFLRDTLAGTTMRVSVGPDGRQGHGTSSSPAISADGRFVAFASTASDLALGDTNGAQDIFVRGPLVAQAAPYTLADVATTLRIGAGLLTSTSGQTARLNVNAPAGIDLRDALSIARKVAGLDANPGG